MSQKELDELFADYKAHGLRAMCPAEPGEERDRWAEERTYLACRQFVESYEAGVSADLLAHHAAAVEIATMPPGTLALQQAMWSALDTMLMNARDFGLRQSDLLRFRAQVVGSWKDRELTATGSVDFPPRIARLLGGKDGAKS